MRLKKYCLILCVCLLSSCMRLVPIAKPTKYYSPKSHAELVNYIPDGTIFIGTIKIVPGDDACVRSERRKQQALSKIQEEAAKAGADYVVIRDIQISNRDYILDITFSDGYTIEGEMFRIVEK